MTTTFLYRCPVTGYHVQGLIAEAVPQKDDANYHSVTCTACGRVHLVNPMTGKVAGLHQK